MKIDRKAVHEKYHGHCAYCGKAIKLSEMQVDHLIPKAKEDVFNYEQINDYSNLMPACRRCNHYKRANSLELFRMLIQGIPSRLMEREYIFKVGVDYGFFSPKDREVTFYFEQVERR